MSLHIYNTLSKKIEKFIPIDDKKVKMYTCGPTVYDNAHIGNFRTFLFEDLLKRWLQHLGYNVNHVMNITDIDDKTIKRAKDENVALSDITKKYTAKFFEDSNWLKIIPATSYPRATNHIQKIIGLIEKLIKKDFAYLHKDGSVYFDISSLKNYGKLTNLVFDKKNNNLRSQDDEYQKKSVQDFVLWKSYKKTDGDNCWDSPWGKGRPGWHIECSAMSISELGDSFDIHCGGIDNIFPHHENEIAQSESVTGKKFVNYWMHSEFLTTKDVKMSKSVGNIYTISDLQAMGFYPESVRYQLLSSHYRNKVIFSKKKKIESDKAILKFKIFYNLLKSKNANKITGKTLPHSYIQFRKKMNRDLNVPEALAVFFVWMKRASSNIENNMNSTKELGEAWRFTIIFNNIFDFINIQMEKIPKNIKNIVDKRSKARDSKNWVLSDKYRQELLNLGWVVADGKDGQKLTKK
jgi:cysteinyl-tRNA synthetase